MSPCSPARTRRTRASSATGAIAVIAAVGAAAVLAPSALAGAMTVKVGTIGGAQALGIAGSAQADDLGITATDDGRTKFTPAAGNTLTFASPDGGAASRCSAAAGAITCSLAGLGASTSTGITQEQVVVELEAGDDRLNVDGVGSTGIRGLLAFGGEGNDELIGDWETDVFYGGPGHDYLKPRSGPDVALGGDGNDVLHLLGADLGVNIFPADRDDSRSSCGAGTDLVARETNPADADTLEDLASCELDVAEWPMQMLRPTPDSSRYEPGQAVIPVFTPARSKPTVTDIIWEACPQEGKPFTPPAANCTELARGERFDITEAHVGTYLRLTTRQSWTIPDNPMGTWAIPTRVGFAQLVQAKPPVQVTTRPDPAPTGSGPTAEQIRYGLNGRLVPSKNWKPFALAKEGVPVSGDARSYSVHLVASLSVPRKTLGERKKGTTTIAKIDTHVTGDFTQRLKLTPAGRKLRKLLGKKRTAKASYRVWFQVGRAGPVGGKTVDVKVKGG